jgi:hypothetical protein
LHSALFVRPAFDRFGLFDETMAQGEDLDFFLRLAEGNAVVLVEKEVASLYRRHEGNMTRDRRLVQKAHLASLHRSIVRRRAQGSSSPIHGFVLEGQSDELITRFEQHKNAARAFSETV